MTSASSTPSSTPQAPALGAPLTRIWDDLAAMVAYHSVHGDPALRADYESNVDWIVGAFSRLAIELERIECVDDSVALVGAKPAVNGAPTVLLYAHHDVVPAGERGEWDQDPLTLTQRTREDGSARWHGRGTADCKGNIAMHLEALRRLGPLDRVDTGIRVLIEGSEENGGEGLHDLLAKRPELFAADAIIVADTGNAAPGLPCLVTLLRGSAQIRVRCQTLTSPAHSGKFGGVAPDATAALMRTLDSLRDEEGRTRIDGIDCTGHWHGAGYDPERFASDAGVVQGGELIGHPDAEEVADAVWARPAVTVTGFSSTPVEEAVNAVPAEAAAQVNLRVPPRLKDDGGHRLSTEDAARLLAAHLQEHVPWGARLEVDIQDTSTGYQAEAGGLNLLRDCLTEAYGTPAREIGTGGSIPLTVDLHEAFPEAAIALLGVADTSAAIHSPDESVDPQEIVHMAEAEALFIARYGQKPRG